VAAADAEFRQNEKTMQMQRQTMPPTNTNDAMDALDTVSEDTEAADPSNSLPRVLLTDVSIMDCAWYLIGSIES
jgi:hypothetical protein